MPFKVEVFPAGISKSYRLDNNTEVGCHCLLPVLNLKLFSPVSVDFLQTERDQLIPVLSISLSIHTPLSNLLARVIYTELQPSGSYESLLYPHHNKMVIFHHPQINTYLSFFLSPFFTIISQASAAASRQETNSSKVF